MGCVQFVHRELDHLTSPELWHLSHALVTQ
jgi:hypothetical protein